MVWRWAWDPRRSSVREKQMIVDPMPLPPFLGSDWRQPDGVGLASTALPRRPAHLVPRTGRGLPVDVGQRREPGLAGPDVVRPAPVRPQQRPLTSSDLP